MGFKVGLSEDQHKQVGDVLQGAGEVTGALSAMFPALLPIATLLGGGGMVWKRMKKTVTKQRAPLEMLVKALENVKQQDAEAWAKVKGQIEKQYPTIDIKGTIEEVKATLAEQGKLATS